MLIINLSKLEENVLKITKKTNLIAVVKNNAYGCGVIPVSKKLLSLGVKILFVNDASEALELLNHKIDAQIIIHNSLTAKDLFLLKHPNIIPSINSFADCLLLQNYPQIKVHIQIDTGMNRLGIKTLAEYQESITFLKTKNIIIDGLYTHFASTQKAPLQLAKFQKFIAVIKVPIVHLSSSATLSSGNYARIGLNLYNNVMSIIVKPIAIRLLVKGESIGYDSLYTASEDEKIAILPLGYGNGYFRKYEGFHIYSQGKFYPIVGRICMNHLFIRIDDNIDLNSQCEVLSENIPASTLADYTSLSLYELYTNFKFREVKYIE